MIYGNCRDVEWWYVQLVLTARCFLIEPRPHDSLLVAIHNPIRLLLYDRSRHLHQFLYVLTCKVLSNVLFELLIPLSGPCELFFSDLLVYQSYCDFVQFGGHCDELVRSVVHEQGFHKSVHVFINCRQFRLSIGHLSIHAGEACIANELNLFCNVHQ